MKSYRPTLRVASYRSTRSTTRAFVSAFISEAHLDGFGTNTDTDISRAGSSSNRSYELAILSWSPLTGPAVYIPALGHLGHPTRVRVLRSLFTTRSRELWAHEVTVPSLLTAFTTRSFLEQQEDAVRTAHPASWTESPTSSIRASVAKSLKRLPGPLGVGHLTLLPPVRYASAEHRASPLHASS